jgi:ATP-dependent Clp protease ATP-binding subunit ClpB
LHPNKTVLTLLALTGFLRPVRELLRQPTRNFSIMSTAQEPQPIINLDTATFTELDTSFRGELASNLETFLSYRVIGQRRAVKAIVDMYETFRAGLSPEGRPIGSFLFMGPTGVGKTSSVEATAEFLFGSSTNLIKIDCGEFQHSHEIAKLIGSPPGYLGHRETAPVLTPENIAKNHTDRDKFSIILFDEIEKSSDALWNLLLNILDRAVVTLGDNRRVDMSQTFIIMTSNIGAREMSNLISGSIGFAPARAASLMVTEVDQKIYQTAIESARKKFTPEFMNRIDKTVVFRSLTADQLTKIVTLELDLLQKRILQNSGKKFVLTHTDAAKALLLDEGIDYRYGARHLKRAIRRFVETPLSRLLSTGQIKDGATIKVDEREGKLVFLSAS